MCVATNEVIHTYVILNGDIHFGAIIYYINNGPYFEENRARMGTVIGCDEAN